MTMKIAKTFKWEAAHRLPWHKGACKNVHGHSYHMTVELHGNPNEQGMVVDFSCIGELVKPLIDAWDHATLVAKNDSDLTSALQTLDSKHYILPFDSTSENLCSFVANFIRREGREMLKRYSIEKISIKVQETETCYAAAEYLVSSLEKKNLPEISTNHQTIAYVG